MIRIHKALVVVVMASILASGCSTTPPDQVVTKFLDALKALDPAEMQKHILLEKNAKTTDVVPTKTDDPRQEQALKSMLAKMSYKVGKPSISGESARVSVQLTVVDMTRILSDVMAKALPAAFAAAFGGSQASKDVENLMIQTLVNSIGDPNAPMTTTNITFNLKKVNGQWKIIGDEAFGKAFLNALTAGAANIFGRQ